ncbi:MAG TPA: DJ-1/PfpI family protein, partial [Acidimicrobiia bacterium]
MTSTTHRVAILIFDGVDLLDVGGPYEVFLTASRLAVRDSRPPPFEVTTVSVDGRRRTAYGGLRLEPERSIESVVSDVFVVPGLVDVPAATGDEVLIDAIRDAGSSAAILASVCTGALLLASAGLLDGTVATTHFEDVDQLGELIGRGRAVEEHFGVLVNGLKDLSTTKLSLRHQRT